MPHRRFAHPPEEENMSNPGLAEKVRALTGYTFNNPKLLRQAFTHSSYDSKQNYERLEFLGDRIVGFIVADHLVMHTPVGWKEGDLNTRQVHAVNAKTLAAICRRTGLDEFILHKVRKTSTDGVCADVLEAFIAVLHIDDPNGGLDRCRQFIYQQWFEDDFLLTLATRDPKSLLQEWAQGRGLSVPSYAVIARQGEDHAPSFLVEAKLEGIDPRQGSGNSIKQAQMMAAQELLEYIEANPTDADHVITQP